MDETHMQINRFTGLTSVIASLILGFSLLVILVQTIQAQENAVAVVDIDGSRKTIDADKTQPGKVVGYSVFINNGSNSTLFQVSMRDALPLELSLLPESLEITGGGIGDYGVDNGVITWTGTIAANSELVVRFQAQLTDTLMTGSRITNTAVITASGVVISRSAVTEITTATLGSFLPIVYVPMPSPQLTLLARPNAQNQWTLGWSSDASESITGWELQEAQRSDFQGATTINLPAGTNSVQRSHSPSINSAYYYRIRAMADTTSSSWSNTIFVVGPYRDDFNNANSGWALRRTTYVEKTASWYTGNQELALVVDDRWDWMIVSPLMRAPEPPYYIEYRARVNDPSNLITGGLVVGGDWNGLPCPDYSSFDSLYKGTNCFNQFYNFNYIFYGPIKLLFERVDQLVWCLECGGSPMKRVGDISNTWPAFKVFDNGPAENWHTYRVEVRADGLKLFTDGSFVHSFSTRRYVNRPYFGIFASTDEYKPSIWLVDYFEVGFLE